jgi:hypothetical protein
MEYDTVNSSQVKYMIVTRHKNMLSVLRDRRRKNGLALLNERVINERKNECVNK